MSGRCCQPSGGAASRSPTPSSSTWGGESIWTCSARHIATRTAVESGSSLCSPLTLALVFVEPVLDRLRAVHMKPGAEIRPCAIGDIGEHGFHLADALPVDRESLVRLERGGTRFRDGDCLAVLQLVAANRRVVLVVEVDTRHNDLMLQVHRHDPPAANAVVIAVIAHGEIFGAAHVDTAALLAGRHRHVRRRMPILQALAVRGEDGWLLARVVLDAREVCVDDLHQLLARAALRWRHDLR